LAIDSTSFPENSELSLVCSHWLKISKNLFVIPGTELCFAGTISSSPDIQPGHVLLCDGKDGTQKVTLKIKAFLCYILGQEATSWIGAPADVCITVVEK